MKVGVLGSGTVGKTLAAGLLKHDHQVLLGTRDPQAEDVAPWVAKTPGAKVGTFAEAAKFGDLLIIAVLARAVQDVIKLAGPENFSGKTLIDTNNPISDAPPVDAGAKAQVSDIIRQFGWEPFDCGTIVAARALEPLCMLWCIPGFRSNQWTHALKLLTK